MKTLQDKTQTTTQQETRRAGFSLAELMVVIVIIGLLATAVIPKLMDKFGQSQVAKAKIDINAIDDALKSFAINNAGRYPESIEDLITPDPNGRRYLEQTTVPRDPWGNEYLYEPPSGATPDPVVMSYGKDGQPGGEADDRDITIQMIRNGEI